MQYLKIESNQITLPFEVLRKLKGRVIQFVDFKDGFLIKPVSDLEESPKNLDENNMSSQDAYDYVRMKILEENPELASRNKEEIMESFDRISQKIADGLRREKHGHLQKQMIQNLRFLFLGIKRPNTAPERKFNLHKLLPNISLLPK